MRRSVACARRFCVWSSGARNFSCSGTRVFRPAGVQLPAGGVEAGEAPVQAAVRELYEESGLQLPAPRFLVSCRWEARLPGRFTCQVCHAYAFTAPLGLPDAWSHPADGHTFVYRWASLDAPGLDWEMDAALPYLNSVPAPLQETAHD